MTLDELIAELRADRASRRGPSVYASDRVFMLLDAFDVEREANDCRSGTRAVAPTPRSAHGPYGYLIKPVGLNEEHWYLSDDPSGKPEEETSVPLYAAEDQAASSSTPTQREAEADAADRIWLRFADNGNIRKWDKKAFEERTEYVPASALATQTPQQANDAAMQRYAVERDREKRMASVSGGDYVPAHGDVRQDIAMSDEDEYEKMPGIRCSQLRAGDVLDADDVAAIQKLLDELDEFENKAVDEFHEGRKQAFFEIGGQELLDAVEAADKAFIESAARRAIALMQKRRAKFDKDEARGGENG